jgi:hypothetical protein
MSTESTSDYLTGLYRKALAGTVAADEVFMPTVTYTMEAQIHAMTLWKPHLHWIAYAAAIMATSSDVDTVFVGGDAEVYTLSSLGVEYHHGLMVWQIPRVGMATLVGHPYNRVGGEAIFGLPKQVNDPDSWVVQAFHTACQQHEPSMLFQEAIVHAGHPVDEHESPLESIVIKGADGKLHAYDVTALDGIAEDPGADPKWN